MFMKNTRVHDGENRKIRACCSFSIPVFLMLGLTLVGRLEAQNGKVSDFGSNPDPTQVAAVSASEDYIIGPDDILNIYILDVAELSRDYRVSAIGSITMPVLAK